jgi:hypothetical protein
VAGARHLRLDEEQVGAVLRAEGAEAAGGGRGGRDGDLRACRADFLDPAGDQVLANRCRVRLCERVVDLVVWGVGDAADHP